MTTGGTQHGKTPPLPERSRRARWFARLMFTSQRTTAPYTQVCGMNGSTAAEVSQSNGASRVQRLRLRLCCFHWNYGLFAFHAWTPQNYQQPIVECLSTAGFSKRSNSLAPPFVATEPGKSISCIPNSICNQCCHGQST